MQALGCHRLWPHWGLLLLLLGMPPRGLAPPPIRYSHAGICPNDMNPNLWVDAQSTCKRECETDQVSGMPESQGEQVSIGAMGQGPGKEVGVMFELLGTGHLWVPSLLGWGLQ